MSHLEQQIQRPMREWNKKSGEDKQLVDFWNLHHNGCQRIRFGLWNIIWISRLTAVSEDIGSTAITLKHIIVFCFYFFGDVKFSLTSPIQLSRQPALLRKALNTRGANFKHDNYLQRRDKQRSYASKSLKFAVRCSWQQSSKILRVRLCLAFKLYIEIWLQEHCLNWELIFAVVGSYSWQY